MSSITVKRLKPRNAFVAACLFRKAGAHGRVPARHRRAAAADLRRELRDVDRQRHVP